MKNFVHKVVLVGLVAGIAVLGGCTDDDDPVKSTTTTSTPLPGDVRMHDSNLPCEDVRAESGHLMRCAS